jgi:hypothetical protein
MTAQALSCSVVFGSTRVVHSARDPTFLGCVVENRLAFLLLPVSCAAVGAWWLQTVENEAGLGTPTKQP